MPAANRDMFEKLWGKESALDVESFVIRRGDDNLTVNVGDCYLFTHAGMNRRKPQCLDAYWKGMVTGIKSIASQPDALVQVRWFWAKSDIEMLAKGLVVDPKLKKILDATGKSELFPGQDLVINSSDSIEWEVDIIQLTDAMDQEPVVDYFFRLVWDESLMVMHGSQALGCGILNCHDLKLWNLDKEEQRYCYDCQKWYHSSCLTVSKGTTQDTILERHTLENPDIPEILLRAAFQPASRGGPRHFTAGNIRMVTKARELVVNKEERVNFSKGLAWSEEEWISSLENHFGLLELDRGNFEREQLVVGGQDIYNCGRCNALV